MSNKMKDLYAGLQDRLDAAGNHLKKATAEMQSVSKETEAELRSKLSAAKTKAAEMKADAKATKAKLQELAETKTAEVEEQVTEWKAKRQTDKLEKRAERAEEYAETCVAVALASAAEAEEAILEALAARMDADNA
mgnify:FL=1